MMTVDDFSDALDRLGADLARWPAELRRQAEALVAKDLEAAARLVEARRVDGLLRVAIEPKPVDAAQIGRILLAARGDALPGETGSRVGSRFYAWAGGGLAACLAAGFLIGQAIPASSGDQEIAQLLFSDIAFGAAGLGVEQ